MPLTSCTTGFIVDNKVFVLNNGGLDDFFKNSGQYILTGIKTCNMSKNAMPYHAFTG